VTLPTSNKRPGRAPYRYYFTNFNFGRPPDLFSPPPFLDTHNGNSCSSPFSLDWQRDADWGILFVPGPSFFFRSWLPPCIFTHKEPKFFFPPPFLLPRFHCTTFSLYAKPNKQMYGFFSLAPWLPFQFFSLLVLDGF